MVHSGPKSRVLANAPIHSLTILIQTVVFMGKPLGLKVTFMLTSNHYNDLFCLQLATILIFDIRT